MAAMGVPGALLPLVIALEVGGAIAIIVGYRTRLVAFLLAGFSSCPRSSSTARSATRCSSSCS